MLVICSESGFNDKIFAKLCVQVPKFWTDFCTFFAEVAEKIIFFIFFFMELLTNYVGVIVPSFKLYNLRVIY